MADKKKLNIKISPLAFIQTGIGEIAIYPISFGHQLEFYKKLGNLINQSGQEEVVKKYLPYICYKSAELSDDNNKPTEQTISEKDIAKLSVPEIEAICKNYTKNNDYLTKEKVTETSVNSDGQTVFATKVGEILLQKNANETESEYLYKLLIIEEANHKETLKKMYRPIKSMLHFSKGLNKNIHNIFNLGESLQKSSAPTTAKATIQPMPSKIDALDLAQLARDSEKQRLKPYKDMVGRLDRLIDHSEKAANFMVEANVIQTNIASEIKDSGDSAYKFSKTNIFISFIIVLLTSINIWMPFYIFNKQSPASQGKFDELNGNIEHISQKIEELNNGLESSNNDIRSSLAELIKTNKNLLNTQIILSAKLISLQQKALEQTADTKTQMKKENEKTITGK